MNRHAAALSSLVREILALRLVRYLMAAVVGAVVDIAIFAGLVYGAGVNYLWAGVAGFLVATLANYLVSIRIVFSSGARFPRVAELGMIYAISATGLVWHQAILYLCVERVELHLMVSKLVAIGTVFFWNYQLRRRFVFAPVRS